MTIFRVFMFLTNLCLAILVVHSWLVNNMWNTPGELKILLYTVFGLSAMTYWHWWSALIDKDRKEKEKWKRREEKNE